MTDNNNSQQSTQSIADYLAQLLKDRKQLAAFPNVFNHVERLLDEGKIALFISLNLLFQHSERSSSAMKVSFTIAVRMKNLSQYF
ncbi:STAR_dimer domain-containing protein [Sergentomyia squamirostris]